MRKLFTLLILVFLWSTGMTQERRVASNAVSSGSFAPQPVQSINPLSPTQGVDMNAATLNQSQGILSVSNKIEKKVQKVNPKSLPETTINPLAPLQGGENIGTAFVLAGPLPITSSGTTSGYLDDYDEACTATSTAPDVVYSYTPAADVVVDIDLCGSAYDTKVFVYENTYTPGAPFACDDDFYTSSTDPCGQWVSKIGEVSLVGGNTYYIVIDGYSGTDFGAYELEIREYIPPPPCVWGVDIIPPAGAVAESEACGDDTNGGCNMDPGLETWEPVPSTGGTITGTVWADLATRDTDWFELVLTQASEVTLTANADQLIIYGYITGTFTPGAPDCATVTSISPNNTAGPCNQTSLNVGVLTPGTYWFFVGMTVYEGFPCTNNYFITFSVVPETCPPPSALTATNKTTTTADLGWTPGGSEIGWVAEVGLPGFDPGTGAHVFKDSPVVNYTTATGLSAGTPYQMYVQADCNGTLSAWAGPVNFATNIECPGGAIVELEACGDSINNACNNVLPINQTSQPLALGQTVCGTSSFDGTTRDSDWYSFTLTEAQEVTLSGKADFDLQLLLVTSPCPASVIAAGTALAGVTATVSTQLGPGTYYAWVGPQFTGVFACGDDNEYYATLTGAAITEYCTPAPSSVDGLGITNVAFSTVNNPTGAEAGNYGDYSAMIGDVQRTATIPVLITYQTGYTYVTKIWIDWNDDYFFDASEEVYSGTSLSTNPTTLAASFFVPVDAPLGNHRMRIGGADTGPPTPCYTGSYGSFEDYTVNVLAAPACPAPSSLMVSNIQPNQVDIDWTENGSATLWNIIYGAPGFDPLTEGTLISGVAKPYTLSGLTSSTGYDVYVQADCGGSTSSWFGPNNFTTACDAIAALPWTEGFEGVSIPAIPDCWSENGDWITTNNASSSNDADARTGAQFLRESWFATDEYVWTPGFSLTSGMSYDFSFWWAGDNYAGWTGDVFYNSSPAATGATQMGTSFVTDATVTTKTYAQVIRTFVPSSTGIYYFAIRVNCPSSSPWYLSFDDFKVEVTPACPAPNALTATGMTLTTADLGWTEVGTATLWDIEVVEFGDTPTGVPTHPAVSTNPYTVTGLQASTHYEFYVRAKCTEDSDWSGAKDFYTECGAFDLPYTENFDGVTPPAIPACMSVTNDNGDGVQWVTSTSSPRSAPNAMRISYNGSLAMDDWFFTPGLNLEPGTYNVSFWYRSSGSYAEALEVKWGTSPDAGGMTSAAIFDNNNILNSTYQEGTGVITITSAGVYYVGWHGYSEADMWYLLVDDISIAVPPAYKTLNLTEVLLEGLYIGGGNMRMADDGLGNPQFPGYADEITVELHDGAAYGTILHTATVLLSTTGDATVSDIPAALSGNYYITVKHRNSVETVSATAVSFAGDIVNQSFGAPADVYFGNLQLMVDTYYTIFAGDVNQDGIVDTGDMTDVDNDSANYASGYLPTDVTGDGTVDTSDMTIVDNNSSNYVGTITP